MRRRLLVSQFVLLSHLAYLRSSLKLCDASRMSTIPTCVYQNVKFYQIGLLEEVFRIRIRCISKTLASWIQILINMLIHGSGLKWQNINQKLQKKLFTLKPKTEHLKKEIIKISSFLNGFSINIREKNKKQIWKFCLVNKLRES